MKRGFTLIELLLVMGIIGVVLGVGLTIISSIIRSSTKASITNLVAENGDFAIETISRSVRSAVDVCSSNSDTTLSLYSTKVTCVGSGETTRFDCDTDANGNGAIKKSDLGGTSIALTNENSGNKALGVKVASCTFHASDTVPKRVIIDFTLTQGYGLGTSPETSVSIPFHTEVTLRNF